MYKIAILWPCLLLFACATKKEEKISTTPTSVQVLVENPREAEAYLFESARYSTAGEHYGCIDTALLDEEGKYTFDFGLATQGFYLIRFGDSARLGGSSYVLFLQPGDSLTLTADRMDSTLSFKVLGGNNTKYLTYISEERNMQELDPVNLNRSKAMLYMSPIDAGQLNNSIKVQSSQFFKSYFAGRTIDGEFERYIVRRNEYAHAVRALRYLFDSPKRSVSGTRIIFTDPNYFYYLDYVSQNDDYLLFTEQYRLYAFLTKWLATHQELAVDPDSIFRERALRTFIDIVLRSDKGEKLASNLLQARSIFPQVCSSKGFFETVEYLRKALDYDSTGSTFASSMRSYCDAWLLLKPGKKLPPFEAETVQGTRLSAGGLSGLLVLYRSKSDWQRIEALLPPDSVTTAVYLAGDQSEVAAWRAQMLAAKSTAIQHTILYGDNALSVAKAYQVSEASNCFQVSQGTMTRAFLPLEATGFVPNYLP